jgi:alpha-galactosidase
MTAPAMGLTALWLLTCPAALTAQAERLELPRAKYATGDDSTRSQVGYDDSGWKEISTLASYESQGYEGYDGWSWYRIHVLIPASLRNTVHWQERLLLYLSSLDDVDETFFNGVRIGQTGRGPDDPRGYDSRWQAVRAYYVDLASGVVRWDQDNVIAIRVYDGGGPGGFYRDMSYLRMAEIVDGVRLDATGITYRYAPGRVTATVRVENTFPVDLRGSLSYEIYDAAAGRTLRRRNTALGLPAGASREVRVTTPARAGIELRYRYTEQTSGKAMTAASPVPYLLTPPEPPYPRINGARVIGVRPGSPFLFRVPATGRAPLTFAARDLPSGLALDPATGIITGSVARPGDYALRLRVSNTLGRAERLLEIRVGETLALTPPMGWNSWNAHGLGVTDARVRESADAIIESGLAAHGWTYLNIDDGWEADQRAPDGEIRTNAKFPDMQALGAWLHARGLRFGIYSSPGPETCGGFLGSWQHERQDAESYAGWGIDYLKYDLCSYQRLMAREPTLEEHQRPYRLMSAALGAQARDIVFSLCQYGLREVWSWGAQVGGNSWRTTGDIEDTWESVTRIAAAQDAAAPYAEPGHWNDPDMLVVGVVGWGGAPHASRLTPDEQYSHITLWSLLAAPLLLGNDLTRLDPFTRNLLTNDEVIAVDQDPLGAAARRVLDQDGWQVWVRKLADGRQVFGVFNLAAEYRTLHLDAGALGLTAGAPLRDLWRQRPAGTLTAGFPARVPAHGVLLLAAGSGGAD